VTAKQREKGEKGAAKKVLWGFCREEGVEELAHLRSRERKGKGLHNRRRSLEPKNLLWERWEPQKTK